MTDDYASALGPRGWIKVDTETLPWLTLEEFNVKYPELNGFSLGALSIKILSINPQTLAMSALLKFPEGYRLPAGNWGAGFRAFILDGELAVSGEFMESETWFETSKGEAHQGMAAKVGALIFAKIS